MIYSINYQLFIYTIIIILYIILECQSIDDEKENFGENVKVSNRILRNSEKLEKKVKFSKENILIFSQMISKLVSDLKKEVKHDHTNDEKCHKKLLRISEGGSPVIVIYPDGSDEVTLTSLLYDQSEPWSACRRSCITSRVRKCRVKNLCEVDALIEEAFCYIPGSKCEETVKELTSNRNSTKNPLDEYEINTNEYENNEYYENNADDNDNYNDNENDVSTDDDLYFVDNNDDHDSKHSEGLDYDEYEKEENKIDLYDYEIDRKGNSDFWDQFFNIILPNDEYDLDLFYQPLAPDKSEYYYDYVAEIDEEREEENEDKKNEKESSDVFDVTVKPKRPKKTTTKGCGRSSFSDKIKMFRIVGGTEAIKGSWPWQVGIFNRWKELFCGGTLIAPNWILTAAHCIKKVLYVRIGEHDISIPDGELELKVLKSFKHPNFDIETVDSDIGLIKIPDVKKKQKSFSLKTACLPQPLDSLPLKQSCFALGWGKERETHIFGSDILKYVKVPIVSQKVCERVYNEFYITKNMFCAGVLRGGADACEGDSGGPLLCQNENGQWVLQGVVSFGEGCGERNRLGVYVKVANYVHWINSVIEEN